MADAIQQSIHKGLASNAQLRNQGIQVKSTYGHLSYLYNIQAKNGSANGLNSATSWDADLPYSPSLHVADNRSFILGIKVRNVDGTNTCKPGFMESWFEKSNSFQWLCNGRPFSSQIPAVQTALEPALETSDAEYSSLAKTLNHDQSFTYTSPVSIPANGSAVYFCRVPNPFPKDGLSLGASGAKNQWSLKMNMPSGGSIDSGTGNLQIVDVRLFLNCFTIPEEEIPNYQKAWRTRAWTASEAILLESPQITLTSAGKSPAIKLTNLRNYKVTSIYSFVHASRALAASAYWQLLTPDNAASIVVVSKGGTEIFSASGEPYAYQRYVKGLQQLADSRLLSSVPLVVNNFQWNTQKRLHLGEDGLEENSPYIFDGEETIQITDFGSAATTCYFDSLCYFDSQFVLVDGDIRKLSA